MYFLWLCTFGNNQNVASFFLEGLVSKVLDTRLVALDIFKGFAATGLGPVTLW